MAAWDAGRLRLLELTRGSRQRSPIAIVAEWAEAHSPVLLALDAPLGWPAALGVALAGHRAGGPLEHTPNRLFRRRTDDWVRSRFGKRPLEVGADLIARTAHAALALLEGLRQRPHAQRCHARPFARLVLTGLLSATIGLDLSLPQQIADNRCHADTERLGGFDVAGRRGFVGASIRGRLCHQSSECTEVV